MDRIESIWVAGRGAISPAGILLWICLLLAGPAAAGGGIYTFVDEDGVLHYTNRPYEPRYEQMAEVEPPLRQARPLPQVWKWDGLIGLTARTHDVPPALVKAVIAAESAFDPEAVSHKGAQGLMQLMPETSASLGVEDPLRPEENVAGGVTYLKRMLDRYGDYATALAAYNAGPTAVDRHGGIPPYRETRAYVKRVLTYYRKYHGDFGR